MRDYLQRNHPKGARLLIAFLLAWVAATGVSAQDRRKDFSVAFRVGSAELDASFGDNARTLDSITSLLKRLAADSTLRLRGIRLSGSASPEGSAALNRRLALKRMQNLETYIRSRVELPAHIISRDSSGIGWDRLAQAVSLSDMPRKEEVAVALTHGTPAGRNARLQAIDGGRAWRHLFSNFFPALRNARIACLYAGVQDSVAPQPVPDGGAGSLAAADTTAAAADSLTTAAADSAATPGKERKPLYLAVKTNLLYDAAAVPNIGLEVYLKKGWSLSGEWAAAWWSRDKGHRYWRFAGGMLAARKWLGRRAAAKPLTGHHLGLYAQALTYDVEWGGKGYMGGRPGGRGAQQLNYAAGLEYGFSLPVTRRLNIDFTLGVGYWGGTYHTYTPQDGHYVWQGTFRRRWFGPTNVEVSLAWLLGRGNANAGKGGAK